MDGLFYFAGHGPTRANRTIRRRERFHQHFIQHRARVTTLVVDHEHEPDLFLRQQGYRRIHAGQRAGVRHAERTRIRSSTHGRLRLERLESLHGRYRGRLVTVGGLFALRQLRRFRQPQRNHPIRVENDFVFT